MKTIAITGGYLSQNMGAAAMTIATAAELKKAGHKVILFSKYPQDDREFSLRYNIPLRSCNQYFYTFFVIPLLLIVQLAPPFRAYLKRRYFGGIDLFYDIGGITFSSSRGITGFLINTTWLLLPVLFGIPLIKGSQAIGPFNSWYLKCFAPPLLRNTNQIHTRGSESSATLKMFNIPYQESPDIAFLLEKEPTKIPKSSIKPFISLIPSSVILKRYDRTHGSGAYIRLLHEIAKKYVESGYKIVLIAHSYRHKVTLNSNDYPLCLSLNNLLPHDDVILIDVFGKTPGELKSLIAQSQIVITGRFHGMIAALGCGVPPVVTGWSHKYGEVLNEFNIREQVIDWKILDFARLDQKIQQTLDDRELISEKISANLPDIISRAHQNFSDIEIHAL